MKHYNTLKSSRIVTIIVVVAMLKIRSKRFTLLLLMTLLAISLFTVFPVSAVYKQGKLMKTASVTYEDYEYDPQGTKWTYDVVSGEGRARIRYWTLKSSAFKYFDVVDASEDYIQKGSNLKFTESYGYPETRPVWFILDQDYVSPRIGKVSYVIYGSFAMPGKTQGPLRPRP